MNILIGCEESQAVCMEMRSRGHNAYSCDFKECSGGNPEWHIQGDVLQAIEAGHITLQNADKIYIEHWDMGIFFPTCTYLTCSAEWAYKDGPYHQKVKPGTLTGKARRDARDEAVEFFIKLHHSKIPKVALENPIGVLSSRFRKPDQVIHPYMFGDDASKATCIWVKGLQPLPVPPKTLWAQPRIINGKKRWANQTDSGQNKLPPSKNRAEQRSKTYPGIAKAMGETWTQRQLTLFI